MAEQRDALGTGLGELGVHALLASVEDDNNPTPTDWKLNTQMIRLSAIQPSPFQPRKNMDDAGLQELANSIREHGILQPVVLRPINANTYELIAGERRFRAAKIAEISQIPAVVKDLTDASCAAISIIENIQREDLNIIDQATAISKLIDQFNLTHFQVSKTLGKSRVTITNLLRLLELKEEVKRLVTSGELRMGHARCLLGLPAQDIQLEAAQHMINKNLSVREAEQLVRSLQQKIEQQANPTRTIPKTENDLDDDEPTKTGQQLDMLADAWGKKLSTKVKINHHKLGYGTLVLKYKSLDDLNRMLENISHKHLHSHATEQES